MDDRTEFSARGDAPTEFEIRLLERARGDSAWVMVAQALSRRLGQRVGAQALCVVLDELAGEKPHVPERRNLFEQLWRCELEALIVDLGTGPDAMGYSEIAATLHCSRQYVRQLLRRHRRGNRPDDAPRRTVVTTRP